jgi:hypothetical protein
MLSILISTMLAMSVQDHLEGAEIGDATQFVAFRTGGRYYAERMETRGIRTVARGKWRVEGDRVDVKISSCRGPSCTSLGKPWSARVVVHADRAMTVRSQGSHAPLTSGSYYCKSQGCEKRLGVELVSHARRAGVMDRLLEFLIDKNRTRDVTVVWIGQGQPPPSANTRVIWCGREGDRGKQAAELVMADLAQLGWVDRPRVERGAVDCLYDVRVVVGDAIRAPTEP